MTIFCAAWRYRLFVLCISFLSFCLPLRSQPPGQDSIAHVQGDPEYFIGMFGGYSFLWHSTDLPIFSTLGDCGNFEDGTSQGYFAGLSLDYILLPDLLQLSGRLMYDHREVGLQVNCDNDLTAYDPDSDDYVPYIREHTYDGTLDYLVVDIGARVQPLESIPVYFRASADAGVALFGSDYLQEESIVQPEALLFPDGLARHPTGSGEIDNLATSYGVSAAIGADFELQEDFSIHPEIAFRYGLNSLVQDAEWSVNMLRLGVGLRWQQHETIPTVVPREREPEAEPPLADLPPETVEDAVIAAINTTPLEVRETIVTQTIPLLPYLFFDEGGSELAARYQPEIERADFDPQNLPRETLTTYYHILHIIGRRMRANPSSKLSIRGTTDGREVPADQQNELARRRAEQVRDFLIDNWEIAPERLTLAAARMPQLASSNEYAEGVEENRRVELASDDPFLLGPVVHSRFSEFVPVHSRQKFAVNMRNEHLARQWDLSLQYRGRHVTSFDGDEAPPATVEVPLSNQEMIALGRRINARDSLDGELQIVDLRGQVANAECRFPIIKSREKFEVSRLSLIVFDFDRFDISDDNKVMMDEFVSAAVRDDSRVKIIGSTDRLGDWDYNLDLSDERAQAVRRYLDRIEPDAMLDSVQGIGAADLKYDNDLPEGRYYCRTVALEVQTPLPAADER